MSKEKIERVLFTLEDRIREVVMDIIYDEYGYLNIDDFEDASELIDSLEIKVEFPDAESYT